MGKVPGKPDNPRTVTFIDGQNLFRQAKRCFGYYWPNYDPIKLSEKIALRYPDRELTQVRFYTGIPRIRKDRFWYLWWMSKVKSHSEQDERFLCYLRYLAYHVEEVDYKDPVTGETKTESIEVPREKGVDVRIALDIINLAFRDKYDVAVIFSQDRDLTEAIKDLREAREASDRWIQIECAFPDSKDIPGGFRRGLPGAEWVRISKSDYDACVDMNDYRPSGLGTSSATLLE